MKDLHCCFQAWSQVIITEANCKGTLVQRIVQNTKNQASTVTLHIKRILFIQEQPPMNNTYIAANTCTQTAMNTLTQTYIITTLAHQ